MATTYPEPVEESRTARRAAPPHSMDAEFALLATLMRWDYLYDRIQDDIEPSDFYDPKNRIVFEAIAELANLAEKIEVLTVANAIEASGKLDRIGGPKYLAMINETIVDEKSVVIYADIVRSMAIRRSLIKEASEIIDVAHVPDGSTSTELLQQAEARILSIGDPRANEEFFHELPEVLEAVLDDVKLQQDDHAVGTGVKTGFSYFDELTQGLQKSDLIVLAARPTMGKTALALNIVMNAISREPNVPVLFCSLEQQNAQLVIRLLSSLTNIPYGRIKEGNIQDQEWPTLTTTITGLYDKQLFIVDKSAQSADNMRSYARRIDRELKANGYEDGLGLIVVDYVQLMGADRLRESRTQEVGANTRALKALAKDMNVPVLALSQLNRALENRVNKRPQMSDLRDSGEIEQDADIILFIYRDELYDENSVDKGKAEIIIAKHRNGETGKFKLDFHGPIMLFEDESYSTERRFGERTSPATDEDLAERVDDLDDEDIAF